MLLLTPWACIIGAIAFIVLLFLVELDRFGFATLLMIATIVAAQYFHIADILGWVSKNYAWTLVYVIVYLILGIGWSIGKWVLFLRKFNRKRLEAVSAVQSTAKQEDPPTQSVKDISVHLKHEMYKGTYLSQRPKASDYKGTIIAWMIWWPISMISTFLNDPVRELFNIVYDQLSGLYQTLADKIVSDIEKK